MIQSLLIQTRFPKTAFVERKGREKLTNQCFWAGLRRRSHLLKFDEGVTERISCLPVADDFTAAGDRRWMRGCEVHSRVAER